MGDARKHRASEEPLAPTSTQRVAHVRFGWCLDDGASHDRCRIEFTSSQTKQQCICNCSCHGTTK